MGVNHFDYDRISFSDYSRENISQTFFSSGRVLPWVLQELVIDGFRAHDDVRILQTYFPHKKGELHLWICNIYWACSE